MEFGRVDSLELSEIEFGLPVDSELTNKTLLESNGNDGLNIYVGCPRWGNKGWIGRVYPPKTNEKQFLNEYSKQFNSIELNATFYSIPKPEDVKRWKDQVSDRPDFKFCPRFPQAITHIRRLKNAEVQTAQFYESIKGFGDKLGALMLQLGDNFSPKSFDNLKPYLETLPQDIPVFLEVRHKDWFRDQETRQNLFYTMHDLKIGAVITDTAGRRDCAHMELTTPRTMIRFVGNNLHPTDYARADEWVKRIKSWKEKGLRTLWFFVHQLDENNSPEMCEYVIGELNKELGTNLRPPRLIK
ncbi:DUF72 domain-containing protein [Mucilaginibacter sp. SG564]|uniref:DUF72 domain-containing protein n=1 Tax=Mucilaginibacter sp. SG564 TaxID=2587022 RepID=UPI0015579A4F|nr:DUF72 domain-containing protein [Mucilaginibacter sp. SG564]NOW96083.1 uncharacterized protein YecE (DUF72 family) [Mucilaginibacter sp. SG564]